MSEAPAPRGDSPLSNRDRVQFAIEAWKTTIDVQKHFNELQLSIRKVAITFGGAVLGAAALFYKEDHQSYIPAILVMLGLAAAILFRVLDRHSYHRFLVSSVRHGIAIEEYLGRATGMTVAEQPVAASAFSLSAAITRGSAIPPNEVGWWLRPVAYFSKDGKIHSHHRLAILYAGFLLILFAIGTGLFWNAYTKRHADRTALSVDAPSVLGSNLVCGPEPGAAPLR